MIFFDRNRLFLRAVSILTLVGMLPSSVEAWYLLPAAPPPVWDINLDSLLDMDAIEGIAPESLPYVVLAQNELESRRSDLLAKNTPDGAATASPLDKLKDTTKFFEDVTLGPLESPAAKFERYQVAEVLISRTDIATPRGPSGGVEAASRLETAIQDYEARDYAEATGAFMRIINDFPGSHEALAANEYFLNVMEQYVAGHISEEVILQIEQNLPAVESLTVEGKYARLDFYTSGLEDAMYANNVPAQKRFVAGAESGARNFLETHPQSGLSHSAVLYLYDVALARDRMEVLEHDGHAAPGWDINHMGNLAEYLRAQASQMEPGPGRFAAYDVLGQIAARRGGDPGQRMQTRFAIAQEARRPWFNAMLDDPAVYYWVKGRFIYALAYALNDQGQHDAAAEWLDYGINLSTRKSATTYELLVFERARTTHLQHRFEVDGGSEALWDFVEANPGTSNTPVALTLLGSIHMTAGDYNGAATIYSQIIENYPDSEYSAAARRDLAYIGAHLVGSLPALAGDGDKSAEVAQWCGPHALHNLLASLNIFAPARELASLAGTDESGTTMLGLREAASVKGVELSGIQAETIDAVPLPAIAYLDGHHFVLVSALGADTLTVHDGDAPARSMSRFEFARRWQGEALIVTPPKQLAQVFSEEELLARKGGTGGGGLPTDYTGSNDGPGGDYEGGGGDTDNGSCPTGPVPGDASSPPSYTGIHTPGVNLTIQSFRMAPMLNETDVSIPVQSGNVPMSFQRYFTQESYDHRWNNSFPSNPWNNNIGASWSHNYNIYLSNIYPIEDGEGAILFYDANSVPRMYIYDGTSGGKHRYYRTGGHKDEYAVVLEQDTTTQKYTMYFPSGRTIFFSAPASDHARMEKMTDLSGNELTLEYDNSSVFLGRLTKVSEPSGRYALHMAYSGSGRQITKVELKDGGTSPQTYTYAYRSRGHWIYGTTNELTKVTDNNGATVQYAYAQMEFTHDDCDHPIGTMLTKIIDKVGCETTLNQSWPEVEDPYDPEPDHPDYLEIINDDGMKLRYARGGGGVITITNESWNGSAWVPFRKLVNTPVTNDPSRGRYLDYYYDATNYNRWETQWNSIGLLTKELKPGGIVERQVTYTALGRISTETSGSATPVTTYQYDANGLYPTKIIGGDGTETEIFYDAYYRATKRTHPAEPAGHQYEYTPEGYMTKYINPLGDETTYGYDAQGRQTSVTNALSQTSTTEYDHYGKATKSTDASGASTYSFYDDSPLLRLRRVPGPAHQDHRRPGQ